MYIFCKTNNVLECQEGGCKTGYLEKSKGICKHCDTVNIGCIECHYDENYLSDYEDLFVINVMKVV